MKVGFGEAVRSLNDPASRSIAHDSGTLGYPDHLSNMLNYALMVTGGTVTNPTAVDFSAVGFANGRALFFLNSGPDGGGAS